MGDLGAARRHLRHDGAVDRADPLPRTGRSVPADVRFTRAARRLGSRGRAPASRSDMTVRIDPKSWRFQISVICAVALAIRVIVVLTSPHFHTFNDSQQYDEDAVSLAKNGGFPQSAATFHGGPTAYRPPLFPGVLAILYKIVGYGSAHDRWEWGRMLEAVLGALVVLLVFLIARRIWSTRIALVAAGVTAVYPPLILAGSSLLSESVFIPCVLLGVW